MSQRFHPRPSGRTIPVGSGSTDDEVSGRPCGAVGAALPLWWSLGGGGRKAPAARMRQTVRMTDQHSPQGSQPDEENEPARVVVVTQDGMGVSTPGRGRDGSDEEGTNPADLVEQPAKVMRIGSMIKNLLDEVRNAPLDEAGRAPAGGDPPPLDRGAQGRAGPRAGRGARPDRPAVQRDTPPPTPSCGSPRPSSSAGSRACSTASRPRSSPSRWRPSSSSRGCARPAAGSPRRPGPPAPGLPGPGGPQPPERPAPASTSRRLLERRISARLGNNPHA